MKIKAVLYWHDWKKEIFIYSLHYRIRVPVFFPVAERQTVKLVEENTSPSLSHGVDWEFTLNKVEEKGWWLWKRKIAHYKWIRQEMY